VCTLKVLLWKKIWHSKWWPRNGCDGMLKEKNQFWCQVVVKRGEGNTYSPELLFLKFLLLAYNHSHFHFGLYIFFSQLHSWGPHAFCSSWAVLDYIMFRRKWGKPQLNYHTYQLYLSCVTCFKLSCINQKTPHTRPIIWPALSFSFINTVA